VIFWSLVFFDIGLSTSDLADSLGVFWACVLKNGRCETFHCPKITTPVNFQRPLGGWIFIV